MTQPHDPDAERSSTRRALVLLVAATTLAYGCLVGPRSFALFFGGREMAAEALGAFAFLAASLLYLDAWRYARGGLRGMALLGCAAFLFVAFGEEASWGQHWLGFATPEALKEVNAQQETNLHNLWVLDSFAEEGGKKAGWAALLLNSNRLFDAAVLGFFVVLPLLARWPAWTRRLLAKVGLPLPPLALSAVLGFNWLLTLLAEVFLARRDYLLHLAVSEVRELGYALLFLAAAWLARRALAHPRRAI